MGGGVEGLGDGKREGGYLSEGRGVSGWGGRSKGVRVVGELNGRGKGKGRGLYE